MVPCKKRPFQTRAEAKRLVKKLRQKRDAKARWLDYLHAYFCENHAAWHVGHRTGMHTIDRELREGRIA